MTVRILLVVCLAVAAVLTPLFASYRKDIDAIFVINLKTRQDRYQHMLEQEQKVGRQFDYLDAVEAHDHTAHDRINDHQIACWRSHMEALNAFLDTRNLTSVILEDDVVFEEDAFGKFREMVLPWRWDMIYLGECNDYKHPEVTRPDGTFHIYKSRYPGCTQAYMVNRQGAHKLLRLLNSVTEPIDETIIHAVMRGDIHAYGVFPNLVNQDNSFGTDVPTTLG
ncbi:hypothetical protein BZG36_02213 [Bifiguratus adelaidae]|uniref:Glycosyl transferase family 25 domain-containing protein n=1 Tax=Bifiguratus adelaidae TaxID=1938954 RepID=A0A261Y3I5_9FUNG|nr:hypothetical protein BZG36_02213 [Bifiguratus adelaidae]